MVDLEPMGIKNLIASYVLKGNKVAIVESGPMASIRNLLAGLREIGIKTKEVDYVTVSHVHADHAGGAGALLRHLPNAKLLAHAKGAPHLVKPKKLWTQTKQILGKVAEMYGEVQPVPEKRIIIGTDGMVINLGEDVELEVLETPGHASHELSFHENNDRGIFPGDTAGIYLNEFDMVIPTTPTPFRLEKALASLNRLVEMTPKKLYYTHFGPADDAVKKLKAYAAQLKLWGKIILEGMESEEELESLYERILEKDASMKAAAEFISNHVVLGGDTIRNIQGFIEYFRKSKTLFSSFQR